MSMDPQIQLLGRIKRELRKAVDAAPTLEQKRFLIDFAVKCLGELTDEVDADDASKRT